MVGHGQSESASSEAQSEAQSEAEGGQWLEDVQPRTQVPRRSDLSGLLAQRRQASRRQGREEDEALALVR